ncbi:MAG TPA: TetR/AcrR family transcriptional regulator [Acidimicrobiales bacterium]
MTPPPTSSADAPPAERSRSRRAAALPPDERRAAIVEATVPLLVELGEAVSTRQIAEAAGVAEGTIFRVFPDKPAVIRAALEAAFDPAPVDAALGAIDPDLAMEDQLAEVVVVLQDRVMRTWRLFALARDTGVVDGPPTRAPDLHALTSLMERFADQLSVDPHTAAQRFRSVVVATASPVFEPDGPLAPPEVVALVLDGMRRRGEASPC